MYSPRATIVIIGMKGVGKVSGQLSEVVQSSDVCSRQRLE